MLHEVTVKVGELRDTLEKNLEIHKKEYKQAVIDWR